MSFYNLALFAHISGTLTLFMAVAVELASLHRMRGASTTEQLRERASLIRMTEKPLPISTVVILGSGLYMALTGWDLSVPWIGLSLAALVVMSVVGPAVNSRRLNAIDRAAEIALPGPIPPGLVRRIQDPVLLVSVHALAALGFGIVFLKAIKPDFGGAIVVLAIAVSLGVLSARSIARSRSVLAGATDQSGSDGEREAVTTN